MCKIKPKLLIIVGAGASIELGMPSVAKIDELFINWALKDYSLLENKDISLYGFIRDKINQFYNLEPKVCHRKAANYEEVLFTISHLVPFLNDKLYKYPLKALASIKELPEINHLNNIKKPDDDILLELIKFLIDKLLDYFRNECLNVCKNKDFIVFKSFFEKLNNDYNLGIFSLNYDNLIMQYLPNLNTGFNKKDGSFEPEKVLFSTDWNFCYHLHGSVHFDMKITNDSMHSICWQNDLNSTFNQNCSGRNNITTREGIELPISNIIAGYDKVNQIQREPFRSYYNRLDRAILEADYVMFIGYGFADEHINVCFKDLYNPLSSKIKKTVLVVDFAYDNQYPLADRCDDWSYNVTNTLKFAIQNMSSPGSSYPAEIYNLKKSKECEVSNNPKYPVAIWYNGLLDLCKSYEKVSEYLNYHNKIRV